MGPASVWWLACIASATTFVAEGADDYARLMNLGKAHLENRNSAQAIESFREATRLQPQEAPAWRNLARAHLLARQHEPALEALSRAGEIEPQSSATSYLAGISCTRLLRAEEAVRHLEAAVRLDAWTAALRYQLAAAYQAAGRHDDARKQFQETVRIDPLHAGAHFKLATYARQAGEREGFDRHYREFVRLQKLFGDQARSPEALEKCVYTQPEPAPGPPPAGPEASPPAPPDVRFIDVTGQVFRDDGDRAAAVAAVLETDERGRCVVFVVGDDGRPALLSMSDEGVWRRHPAGSPLTGFTSFTTCTIGDYHNDVPAGAKYDPKLHALNDALLAGPDGVRLLKRSGPDAFEDATAPAGLSQVKADGACWVDYEHDGDLDLLVAGDGGLHLWQNNGDGRFENVTAAVGITETGPATACAAVDLDANVAIDAIVARGQRPTLVFENQRTGRFAAMSEPPGPWPGASSLLVNDLNNDGHADAVLLGNRQATILLGRMPQRQSVDLTGVEPAAAVLLDYDNDGWLDLCVAGTDRATPGQGAVALFRNAGPAGWQDVRRSAGLDAGATVPPLRSLVAGDVDADGDTDLLLVDRNHRLHVLRNEGGHTNGQLKLRLVTLKTNPTGLGTHLELRAGRSLISRAVAVLPIEIGLGGRSRFDSLQTVWTNGVVDNQIDLSVPPGVVTIVEKNVAAGSCPFLYVWDGNRFRFVTDILGNAPIGLPISRRAMLPADPDEIVEIGPAEGTPNAMVRVWGPQRFPPRDDRYVVQVTDEFREVDYLDQVRLVAVDHPPGHEVHPTDKLMPPPFPPSQLWAVTCPLSLLAAGGSDGVDRTEDLRERDGRFAPPGLPLPPPLRGMCEPLSVTLDFGPLDPSRELVLVLTGWLQYGDASTNIALSQNREVRVIPPTLEAETAPDRWQHVDVVVGMPAGKTKTILVDLTGKLPPGSRRLRLTTTFEIRWDRVGLFERAELAAERVHELAPAWAELCWRGFSEIRSRAPGHPTTPDHGVVADEPAWRTTPQGWCTRYGDVLELVRERDGRMAIFNAGDAVTIAFDARSLPPVPDGLRRTFFFFSVGWDKDADHNVAGGESVEPVPFEGDRPPDRPPPTDDDPLPDFNTRWVPWDRFAGGR